MAMLFLNDDPAVSRDAVLKMSSTQVETFLATLVAVEFDQHQGLVAQSMFDDFYSLDVIQSEARLAREFIQGVLADVATERATSPAAV